MAKRAEIASTARKEMNKIMAKLRLQRALKHRTASSTDAVFQPGDKVLVWREKIVNNRIGEWMGPFLVESVQIENKLVHVRDDNKGTTTPFNFYQVKKYFEPDMLSSSYMKQLDSHLRGLSTMYNSPPQLDSYYGTFLTEVLKKQDPRASSPEMKAAIHKEVTGLMEAGTFKIILHEEVPEDANILPGRFVLAIKSTNDNEISIKLASL